MQNKANSARPKMNASSIITKYYEKRWALRGEQKQSQSKPISDYPCVFELAGYNLVLRDGKMKDFDGEYVKWQVHLKPMRW
jgi:hypothetical protein